MVRRLFSWLLPAALTLAFAASMSGADAKAAALFEWCADAGAGSIVVSPIHHNDEGAGWSQSTGADDDDRIVEASEIIVWTRAPIAIPPRRVSNILFRSYPTTASFPRGPPSA
jgi:hypothetical protein